VRCFFSWRDFITAGIRGLYGSIIALSGMSESMKSGLISLTAG
jgi:hypothetical protein